MRKKLVLLLITLLVTVSASAQFEQGKKYISASFSGLDMGYNGSSEFNVGLQAKGGYFLADNLAVVGVLGYNHVGGEEDTPDRVSLGLQGRYYILQNGIYLGVGATYKHANHNYNDLMPGVEIGYAFFINQYLTIEPAVYYNMSFNDFSDSSKVGLRIGFGLYF